MEISIESVFLFACALFVLHFIISGCGYTNVEGYRCGFCPISTAKCPPECPATHTDKCGVWGMGTGAKYQCTCTDANFAEGKTVCLDTGSEKNLNIGILDLHVDKPNDGSVFEKAYLSKLQDADNPNSRAWVERTTVIKKKWTLLEDEKRTVKTTPVTDTKKLHLLNQLAATPYYIQNIAITVDSSDSFEIGVKTWNKDKGKHFYFSDRKGDVYCLSVTTYGGESEEEFPHTVGVGNHKMPSYIQYLGYKESNVPIC